MRTQGYYVFLYLNTYYIFYNHNNSYPENGGLGEKIISEFKNLSEKELNILLNTMKNLINNIKLTDNADHNRDVYYSGLIDALEYSSNYVYYISENQPMNDNYIQYIYIIDLDLHKIKIISHNYEKCIIPLNNIPDNWLDVLVSN